MQTAEAAFPVQHPGSCRGLVQMSHMIEEDHLWVDSMCECQSASDLGKREGGTLFQEEPSREVFSAHLLVSFMPSESLIEHGQLT